MLRTLTISILLFCCLNFSLNAQLFSKDTTDLTFTGTRINPYAEEYDSTGNLTISGYIDTYYAYYTDTAGPGGFQKFPTAAPRNSQFGLNIIQVSARYFSQRFRAQATLFYGDCPQSAWSPHLNLVQEANAGFRIAGKLWLDAGFFRTHIGLESIQPRENVTTSFATTTYFEPYYLSGAKLTWQQSDKLTFQLNAFNGFNTFLETNNNKALGFSVSYAPGKNWTHNFSTLLCDESPDGFPQDQLRNYNNYVGVFKTERFTLGLEANFGWQQHSRLGDSSQTAYMYSFLAAGKYRITRKWGVYLRQEFYTDPDEILTGPIENENHTLVGLDILGTTAGIEYKPIPNAYFRVEGRYLQTKSYEKIFYFDGASRNHREEVIVSLGVWF